MSKYSHLLSEVKVGGKTLKNRIALAPMTRARAGTDLLANENIRQYYTKHASSGMIITEGTHISPRARGWVQVPGIWTKEQTEAWKPVTKSVHDANGVICLQLWHQGRQSHSSFHDGKMPVSASAVPLEKPPNTANYDHATEAEIPHALTLEEIDETVQEYVNAAKNAIEAGFDFIEVHNANGYLLDQFLQSKTNKREDDYGGSIENRSKLTLRVLNAVIEAIGNDKVGVRFSPNGAFGEMGSPDFREQFTYIFQEVAKLNLAYVHIMDGLAFGFHGIGEPYKISEIREIFPKETPLMANCGYTPDSAEEVITAGHADMVSFGRPYLANPDLPERLQNGWPLNEPHDHKYWFSPSGPDDAVFNSTEGYVMPTYPEQQATEGSK